MPLTAKQKLKVDEHRVYLFLKTYLTVSESSGDTEVHAVLHARSKEVFDQLVRIDEELTSIMKAHIRVHKIKHGSRSTIQAITGTEIWESARIYKRTILFVLQPLKNQPIPAGRDMIDDEESLDLVRRRHWRRFMNDLVDQNGEPAPNRPALDDCPSMYTFPEFYAYKKLHAHPSLQVVPHRSLPKPPSLSEIEKETDRILRYCWSESDGYTIEQSEKFLFDDDEMPNSSRHESSTYGEVTRVGARQLFHQMGMKDKRREKDMVFLDLGSGTGKLIVQSHLEIPNLTTAIGVELSPSRMQSCQKAWNIVQTQTSSQLEQESRSSVKWIEGDLLDADVSEATHIFVSSLLFPSELNEQLESKLKREAPKLECLAVLKQFDNMGTPIVHSIQMSWTKPDGFAVYFYDPMKANEEF